MLEVAKDFPEYAFAIADEEDYGEELKGLGLSESGEEVNVGILADGGKKFAMEPEELDADVLRDFVMAFKKGEAVTSVLNVYKTLYMKITDPKVLRERSLEFQIKKQTSGITLKCCLWLPCWL